MTTKRLHAIGADKYALYQQAVQSPAADVQLMVRFFREAYGREPVLLREDFCGTAAVSCEWVRSGPRRKSWGVDLDPEPLEWGSKHNLAALNVKQRARVRLIEGDARDAETPQVDVVAAQNFSQYLFLKRDDLRVYFSAAHRNLRKQGMLHMDMMGGSIIVDNDSVESRPFETFTYIWQQHSFDPITQEAEFSIHFRFPDRSLLEDAFRYRWRMWTLPEVRDLLDEVGFRNTTVYWREMDRERGDYVYRRRNHATPAPAWLAALVATK